MTREYDGTRSTRKGAADLEPQPAGAAPRLDRAARLRHDVLHDREPETGAVRRPSTVAAEEPLEEPRQLICWDARSVVGDRDEDDIAFRPRRHGAVRRRRRTRHRVGADGRR